MSREITRTGRFWLMLMILMGILGFFSNILYLNKGLIYLIMSLICIMEIISLFFLLKGRGLIYYIFYIITYSIDAILVKVALGHTNTKDIISTIIGIIINIGLTYLAVKRTIKLNRGK